MFSPSVIIKVLFWTLTIGFEGTIASPQGVDGAFAVDSGPDDTIYRNGIPIGKVDS